MFAFLKPLLDSCPWLHQVMTYLLLPITIPIAIYLVVFEGWMSWKQSFTLCVYLSRKERQQWVFSLRRYLHNPSGKSF